MKTKENLTMLQRLFHLLYRLTLWGGFVAVGVLAVPAVLLGLLASGVWCAADRLATWLEQKGEKP